MTISVDITDKASPKFRRLASRLDAREALHGAIAEAVSPVFQHNFQKMAGAEHNKFGARGGFWGRMMQGTSVSASAEAATISMPREVALRYYGGTVTPKTSKLLTIPARAEAYGKAAREFNNLRFAVLAGHPALIEAEHTKISFRRGKNGKLSTINRGAAGGERGAATKVYYWLTPSVTVKPNPAVLPAEDDIRAAAADGIAAYLGGKS